METFHIYHDLKSEDFQVLCKIVKDYSIYLPNEEMYGKIKRLERATFDNGLSTYGTKICKDILNGKHFLVLKVNQDLEDLVDNLVRKMNCETIELCDSFIFIISFNTKYCNFHSIVINGAKVYSTLGESGYYIPPTYSFDSSCAKL